NYRMSSRSEAHVFAGIGITKTEEAKAIQQALETAELPTLNLHDNELAKLHIRHMVGGRSDLVHDEVLFRFEFPERPGALLDFLSQSAGRWNISLFHYRNHGAAFGRVLVGLEVPLDERDALHRFFDDLGFNYVDETDNPAYHSFL
ncbi:MAG: threonine ammonia-lyase, biosynthetic, partial [Mariprofundaceae bacterium]|nr:threonine ammonia-lyase, biosynthetic [Mariprofundaceae bacterium]